MKIFPRDCSEVDCKHCHVFDLSIDDLVVSCDVLGKQADLCDCDFVRIQCPLESEGDK